MNLMVTAREPGTEATSNGSSLMRRTIRPKAFATASRAPETLRIRSGLPGIDSETVTRALDLSYAMISILHFRSKMHETGSRTLKTDDTHSDLVDVRPRPADDDARILSDDQAAHRDLLRGRFCGGDRSGWNGGRGIANSGRGRAGIATGVVH